MVDTFARLRACTTCDENGNVVIRHGDNSVVLIPAKSDKGRSTHEMLNDTITGLADLLDEVLTQS
jgi:hypothetical protein